MNGIDFSKISTELKLFNPISGNFRKTIVYHYKKSGVDQVTTIVRHPKHVYKIRSSVGPWSDTNIVDIGYKYWY